MKNLCKRGGTPSVSPLSGKATPSLQRRCVSGAWVRAEAVSGLEWGNASDAGEGGEASKASQGMLSYCPLFSHCNDVNVLWEALVGGRFGGNFL